MHLMDISAVFRGLRIGDGLGLVGSAMVLLIHFSNVGACSRSIDYGCESGKSHQSQW